MISAWLCRLKVGQAVYAQIGNSGFENGRERFMDTPKTSIFRPKLNICHIYSAWHASTEYQNDVNSSAADLNSVISLI